MHRRGGIFDFYGVPEAEVIRTTCRACKGPLVQILDLGRQPPSNALLPTPDAPEALYPLRLTRCTDCTLCQLDFDVPPAELFGASYPYFSGQSQHWVEHCRKYADLVWDRLALDKDSTVLEIGSNDGTLLKNFIGKCRAIGVDPSASVAAAAERDGVPTTTASFTRAICWPRADLLIANNVLAHTPDIEEFVATMQQTLAIDGVATIEFPWVVSLLEQCQFDTIYHEHYSYLSVTALDKLFRRYNLYIYDLEHLTTHGGSLRLYICRTTFRYVSKSVDNALQREAELDYTHFTRRAKKIRDDFIRFIDYHRGLVYGYGAAAKGNTFLNYCVLSSFDIPAVGDTTPAKVGRFLPGSHIPVASEDELLALAPPYILILPWNWKDEIVTRLRAKGYKGKFVTAIPSLEVFE
jgi:hypothetical protein